MARCKSSPETVRAKRDLADRLRAVRAEQYGERGGPELARRLDLPIRTWYNYEIGVTVPAEVLLRFLKLTGVEPMWLLNGEGPQYRRDAPKPDDADANDGEADPHPAVALLHRALDLLENSPGRHPGARPETDPKLAADLAYVRVDRLEPDGEARGPSVLTARRDWLVDPRHCRCIRLDDDAMTPILPSGSLVGYCDRPEPAAALDGSLVLAEVGGATLVRRLQFTGNHAMLRAENPEAEPQFVAVDLTSDGPSPRFHRVFWANAPRGTSAQAP